MKNPSGKNVMFVFITISSLFLYIYYIKREMGYVGSPKKLPSTDSKYLLTLFTTWREILEKRTVISNTIRNWKSLQPNITNIVFTEKVETYHKLAKEYHWKILSSKTATNESIPILKDMFVRAMKEEKSEFYGYANSDILFTPLLLQTLQSILNFARKENVTVLVVGQRTDISMVNMTNPENISHVLKSGKEKGKLHHPCAVDYFITSPDFPFDDLPSVVIGRPAYDNYVIMHARAHRVSVIDSTETNLAVHQSTSAGNLEGHTHKNYNYNFQILNLTIDKFDSGFVTCSNFQTKFSNISSAPSIKVIKKGLKPSECTRMFESW